LQASHPGFSKEILLYNTIKDEWTANGIIPYETPVTTTAFLFGNEVLLPCGEIKAGVRTPSILAAKLNFKTK
jgi:N-acetylneuraminic acid mutarotase